MVKKSESRLEIRDELITDDIRNSSDNQIFDGTNITTNIGTVDGVDVAELKDISDYADSPMVVSGGEITEGTNAGTFKVAALTALLRTSNSSIGELDYVTLAEQDNQSITLADTLYYVVLNYNGGSPSITLGTSSPYSADKRNIPIGQVMKDSSDNVHYISGGFRFQDGIQKLHSRAKTLRNLELSYGSTIAYSGTNNFTMTDGILYGGINRFALSSYDSAVTAFTYIYSDGAGGWTEVSSNTIDYNHYDDGDGVLGTIGVGRYSCHWVYRHADDGHVYVVYGVGNYKLAEAEVAPEPSKPDYITNFGTLIGCIIAPQTGGSFTEVQMVTDTFFTGTAVATHNDLGGLQGGNINEYYHLTQDDYNLINAITVSATEINYLTGLTENLTTTLAGKVNDSGDTMTGDLTMNGGDIVLGTQSVGYNNTGGLTFDSNNDGALSGDLSFEGNSNFTLFNDSGTHKLQFDTNDWIGFTTATDVLYGYIGGIKSLQIGGVSVDYCNFAGIYAGSFNTGISSNGFGHNSLYNNTGLYSNGFGHASLYNNTGNSSNGFGYASLYNNTGISSNGFGYASLRYNTGSYSNGFGHASLYNNTGISSNGFGYYSLYNNSGLYSNGFGHSSLYNNTGNSSNGFGYASLRYNTGNSSNGFGYYSLLYNEGNYNTAIGHEAFNTFNEDSGNALTVESVDHANNRVTITGHGLGVAGTIRLFKASTTGALPTGLNTNPHQWKVIDANTLECVTDSFTDAGTGTHTLTPQFIYTNSTAIGYKAEPTASNQVMLGDSNVTEVKSAGKGSFSGADLNDNPLQNLKRYRQLTEPSLSASGDMAIWSDSDDDSVYLLYKDADAGQVKIAINLGMPTELDDFIDVTITTPSNGDILYYVTDKFINGSLADAGIASATHDHSGVYLESMGALNDLSDVNADSPSDNQVLSWDASSSKWIAETVGAGVTNIGDLTDVTMAVDLADNDLLVYVTDHWENQTLAEAGLASATHNHDSDYADISHDHDLTYSAITHDHSGVYLESMGTLDDLSNTNLVSVSDNDLLQYDTSSSKWINISIGDAGIATTGDLHNAVTIGTANGLSISAQELSLALASTSTTGALSNTDWNTFNGKQDALTFGIANTNTVVIDDADAAENDYCKLTTTGIVGRSYSEVKTDLSLNNVENTAISSWSGSSNIVTVGTLTSGNVDAAVTDASTSAKGKVELAIASEVDTGTSTSLAVTPDALAGSNLGKRTVQIAVTAPDISLTTGDGKSYFVIPPELNGMNLVDADAAVITSSSSGLPEIDIYNVTDSHDMLSTNITIDVGEYTSYTATTAPVINTSYDDVATGDIIRIDVDTAGTDTTGLIVILSFQLP